MSGRTIRRAPPPPPGSPPQHPAPTPIRQGEGLALLRMVEPYTFVSLDAGVLDWFHRLTYAKYTMAVAQGGPMTEAREAHLDMLQRALTSIEDARGIERKARQAPPPPKTEGKKRMPRRVAPTPEATVRRVIRRGSPSG